MEKQVQNNQSSSTKIMSENTDIIKNSDIILASQLPQEPSPDVFEENE